jgi:hypothetical protein
MVGCGNRSRRAKANQRKRKEDLPGKGKRNG